MLKQFIILGFLLFFARVQAQQTTAYTHYTTPYKTALKLYNSEQYAAAQVIFKNVKSTTKNYLMEANSSYYIANCAVRLNQPNAGNLVTQFLENYPTSVKKNDAFNDVANYYYTNSKYSYAIKWFQKVDENTLFGTTKETFYFKKAYSLFKSNQKKEAKKYFNLVSDSKIYGSQAKYYLGFIAYEGDDYKEAADYFNQVKKNEKYQQKMRYFQADIQFKLGEFNKAIDLASQQLPLSFDQEERSQLNKIIGESYFNLKNYDKALSYLKNYKGKKQKWNNTDHYQLGYVYFKRNEFTAAISQFNKIIEGKNTVAQNGYYHLAKCYLETNKKTEALHAFKNASEMKFNAQIKEDAHLNYAKLSYQIGNPYQSVPEVLIQYLKTYPNTSEKETIEGLLIDSYVTSKNYKEALALLKNKKGLEYKSAYQKVAFYRAIQLFNDGLIADAKILFEVAIKNPENKIITAKANYWNAECDYLLGNYQDAVIGYKLFAMQDSLANFSEAKNLNYQIGYGYFKQKKYEAAIPYFKKYLNNINNTQYINDANLRLGDSYFVTTDYWKAMEVYNHAKQANGIDADYAHFQKAISYGFVGENQKKITDLNLFLTVFKTSKYRDDAYFELGNTYVLVNKTQKALQTYNTLIQQYPKSSYVAKSLLKQGLVHYNTNANEQALNKLKQVIREFPGSSEANQAVATARLIYIDLNRVNEYVTWVKTLDFIDVSNADIDNTAYEAAEKQYLENNTNKAITAFINYLEKFPNGLHNVQAHFYIAQLEFKKGNQSATIPHYKHVINKNRNEFTEQALARLSQVYLETKKWEHAITILERLELEADFSQNIVFAQSNLMKANYNLANYDKAVLYAEKVMQNPKIQKAVKIDTQVTIARSAIKTNQEEKAKKMYGEIQKIAKGAIAAEALYYDAYFTNKAGNYIESNTKIQQLTRNYSGYKYYAAKSLLLMAQNFYALNDAYQATYVLERIIEIFSDYNDIKQEAKTELQRIKTQEAKRNSSIDIEVQPEINPEKEN